MDGLIPKLEMKMINDDESKYADVPSDFPRPASFGALPGAQPKIIVTEYKGKFYPPEGTPPEIHERWQNCEELARQFASELRLDKAANVTLRTETEMLEQHFRIFRKSWLTEDEAKWMIRRMSQILGWPVPPAAST